MKDATKFWMQIVVMPILMLLLSGGGIKVWADSNRVARVTDTKVGYEQLERAIQAIRESYGQAEKTLAAMTQRIERVEDQQTALLTEQRDLMKILVRMAVTNQGVTK